MIIPVILSGGAGTRLWPLSRELEPKHLVNLIGSTTLLQKTVARLNGLDDTGAPIIVGNHAHYQLVLDQLAEIEVQPAAMLLEPIGRNTAPAAAVAAMTGARDGEDPILLVLPADHVIEVPDRDAALATLERRLRDGDVVLVKASRGIELDLLVDALRERLEARSR